MPAADPTLERVSERPLLFRLPGYLAAEHCATLAAWLRDEPALEAAGIMVKHDVTGASCEVPRSASPLVDELADRLEDTLGLPNFLGQTLRFRHYTAGQGHPPHVDTYQMDGFELVATALVCLEAPARGGETVFLDAEEAPIAVRHVTGQLLAWHNLNALGQPEPAANHLATPVEEGDKLILAYFFYAELVDLAHAERGERASAAVRAAFRQAQQPAAPALRGFGRSLTVIDDGVPTETVSLLRTACSDRGVRLVQLNPNRFDFAPERALRDGDMLYRPAISVHASRVEQHLWHSGVATFYRDVDGPCFANINANLTFARAGLAVPRTYWLATGDRALIRTMVDALGGFPVVLKALGHSRGVGVMRADSLPALFSIVDFALAEGTRPLLTSYVPDAVHWRVVVVGDKAVASYRNVTDDDDFRTSGSDAIDDYRATPPEGCLELAVAACHALRVDHGGVDILEHPSGRLYVLEANFPCYYAQAQLQGGVDVAGAMVDCLLAKAEALAPAGPVGPVPLLV
jgi:hypothetical protein